MNATRTRLLRPWALWTAGFLAFPIAGSAGRAVVGPVDDLLAAVLGGAVTGLVLGAGQYLVARGALRPRWVPATALGMAVGLGVGAAAVGYRTSLGDLASMGALTGLVLGVAQALALAPTVRRRWLWALTTPVLWGLGWTVTTLGGIAVEEQWTIFGSFGAITVAALSGLVLHGVLLREEPWRPGHPVAR